MGRLLLWDVDGTLITGGGVGGRSIVEAVTTVAGRALARDAVLMHGKTDPQIIAELFRAAEVADDDAASLLPQAIAECERLLAAAEAELREKGAVMEGVVDVLAACAAVLGVRQTLVTGNLAANAAVKLAAFDLAGWFDPEAGAYGTDHADRDELVPIALERVERLRGERYDPDDVWVIGDTPGDLACARAAGVRCLLVATGAIPLDELVGADAAVPDLTATDEVVALLTG